MRLLARHFKDFSSLGSSRLAKWGFAVSVDEAQSVVGEPSTTESLVADVKTITHLAAYARNEYYLKAYETERAQYYFPPVWTNNNPEVCTLNPVNDFRQRAIYAGDGKARIDIAAGGITRRLILNFAQEGILDFEEIFYLPGTLAEHVASTLDAALLVATAPVSSKPVYGLQDHAAGAYERNSRLWSGVDLTCCSPWNSGTVNRFGFTLLSPIHGIMAAHAQIGIGETIRFIGNDGTVYDRTLIDKETHPAYVPWFPDIAIGILDSALPAAITPARLLPLTWQDKLQADYNGLGLPPPPLMFLDQEEKLSVMDWDRVDTGRLWFKQPASGSLRDAFWEIPIGGDSGNPVFLDIAGALVLLSIFSTSYYGTFLTDYRGDIQLMMDNLSTNNSKATYTLTDADLSAYITL